MLNGMDVSADGMSIYAVWQDIIANNLANVATTGFKRDVLSLEAFKNYLGVSLSEQSNQLSVNSAIDFSQGPIHPTDNPLDLAIEGDGFFTVQTDTGIFYTRAGALTLDNEGRLVTQDGYPVLGEGGIIQIGKFGQIDITDDGRIYLDGKLVDKLQIVWVQDPARNLQKVGGNLFALAPGGAIEEAENFKIKQGALEGSNVNAVREMINMITALRAYEACQKSVTMHDSALERLINEAARIA